MSLGVPLTTTSAREPLIVALEIVELGLRIAQGRQHLADMRVLPERRCDVPDRRCSRIDDLAGASLDGRQVARTIGHAAVRERRSVVDDDARACLAPRRRHPG